jgi:hypothetical protein
MCTSSSFVAIARAGAIDATSKDLALHSTMLAHRLTASE